LEVLVPTVVETHSLGKHYRGLWALCDCSLSLGAGEVFGLLGPNGSGKTTLLRLLMGYLRPSTGRATIAGFDCHRQSVAAHEHVAYLPGEPRLFPTLRGRQALGLLAGLRGARGGLPRALALAASLGLDVQKRVQHMSTGMRQQLALASVLGAETPLLILDEPTANLDPTVRRSVERLIRQAAADGRTVLLSSHVMSEVEEVCDRVGILRAGRLVHLQLLAELRQRYEIRARVLGGVPIQAPSLTGMVALEPLPPDRLRLEVSGDLAPWLAWLAGLPLADVQVERAGLRSVYEAAHELSAA
jgi:ABC-2 type transport system ATP-binding protein